MKWCFRMRCFASCLFLNMSAFAYDFMIDGIYYDKISYNIYTNAIYYVAVTYNVRNDYSGSIIIPASVTYDSQKPTVYQIGSGAFYGCTDLTSVTIPNSVKDISNYAFYGCRSLTSITIPEGVTRISDHTFGGCTGMQSVTIPSTVKEIEEEAFSNCSSLTSVTFPSKVTSIGKYAFSYCGGLTSMKVDEGNTTYDSRNNCNAIIETATNTLIAGCKNTIIPNSVTSIGEDAFHYNSGLTSITIPNSVTSIGVCAFIGCSGLTSVTIPNSVTDIESSTFWKCSSLTSVTIPNSVTSIGFNAFGDCTSLTSVTIPNSVTSLGNSAFEGCSGLTSVTIPNSVKNIGEFAFRNCSSLTSVTIPNSVTNIGQWTFAGCSSLISVTIPNSVTSIGYNAFGDCSALTSVTIPNGVTSIESNAFAGCNGMNDVWCHAENVPATNSYAFYNSPIALATLHVPAGSLEAYKTTAPWSSFGSIVAIEDDGVTTTDVSAMSYAVYAQPAKARKGNKATLTVCMKNTQPITLWQADMTLPAGFTLATDSYGDPMVSISGSRTSTSRHSISTSTLSDGSIRILCSSSNNKTFTGTDGEVATITLNVASNVNDGDYAVKFNNIKIVEANETKHEVDEVVSVITVKSYTLGDVNDDGSIDGVDLVGIVNYILDRPTAGNIREAADVNKDGIIDGSDYVREVNAILGNITLPAMSRGVRKVIEATDDYAIYVNDLNADAGGRTTLKLTMKNIQPITLWQADLVLPEGVNIATDDFGDPLVTITGRTTTARHSIVTSKLADGSIRILCSSSSNKTFTDNDGEVAAITLVVDGSTSSGNYDVVLKNILLVEADETKHTPNQATSKITVKNTSSGVKCAKPTISFVDGKLTFSSEMEDVEYVYEITNADVKKGFASKVSITGTYMVSVYAMKTGYENSDVSTLEFTLGSNSEVYDVNCDGTIDVADIATIIDKMAASARKQKETEE